MPERKRTYWLSLAITLAFCAVAIFGILTFRNTDAIRDSEQLIAQSYAVRELTRECFSSLKDMETGQRGFLITGNPVYLEPYHQGCREMDAEFDRLKQLTVKNSVQQEHLETLRELIDQKRLQLAETIQLRQESPGPAISDEVLKFVASGRGKATMDKVRKLVGEILDEEERLLDLRQRASTFRSAVSKSFIVAGNLISLGLLVLAGFIAHIDRTKRDEAEAAVRANQSELAAVIDSAHDGIVTFDDDLHVRLMNPAAADMHRNERTTGEPDDGSGRLFMDLVPPRLREQVGRDVNDFVFSDETTRSFLEAVGLCGDGSEFPCHRTMTKTSTGGKRFVTMMIRDLSDTKASEAKMREQAAIVEQVRDAILVCDMDDKIMFWNRGSHLLYGYTGEEAVGRSAAELLFADQHAWWDLGRQAILDKGVFAAEVPQLTKDGRDLIVEHRRSLVRDDGGEPVAQLILHFDITERIREEVNQRRSQRLESIGTLAGGIAHDLNNVLTPVLMSAKLIKRGAANHDRLADTIVASAERGGQMIKKLLAFAGGEQGVRQKIDLFEILSEAEEILSHTLPKTIDLQVLCANNLHSVCGDATELSQVVMNLAINARDAMPRGGRLELKADNIAFDPSNGKACDTLNSGPRVLLTVSDTGEGIPREIIDRIFDPFFTTKEQCKGTGLGLATTMGIIRSHGGDINVCSEPGQGTTFSIYLPAAARTGHEPGRTDAGSDTLITGGALLGRGEMVLVVDDESLIAETAQAMLESSGYRVMSARSGIEALESYRTHQQTIDLILLDMMMPGMDGFETKEKLRKIDARVRIVASSGLRRPSADGGRLSDVDGFLPKPYSDDQLLRVIRKALDANKHQEVT